MFAIDVRLLAYVTKNLVFCLRFDKLSGKEVFAVFIVAVVVVILVVAVVIIVSPLTEDSFAL